VSLTDFVLAKINEGSPVEPGSGSGRVLAALEQFAAAALEGGVRHSWGDWVGFTDLERTAWVNAGRIVAAQEARRVALAQRGEAGYLAAAADSEPGALLAVDSATADALAVRLAHGS
jgi:hypothetical protein